MSDEAVPSRSYVVKQGGFTDPIVDAVMNLGRTTGKDDDAAHKKKTRKVNPPETTGSANLTSTTQAPPTGYSPPNLPNPSQHSLVSATRMPGSLPTTNIIPAPAGTLKTVPNPFTTSAGIKPCPLYLPKAPGFSHRASSKSTTLPLASAQPSPGLNEPLGNSPEAPGRSGGKTGGINLVLPSSFPKPPPIAMPQMQQPPKFIPIPEPAWESQRGRSEAEKFKEMVLLGGGTSGPGGLIGSDEPIPVIEKKRRKKKKKRTEVPPVVDMVNPDQPGSEWTARPRGAGETGTMTGGGGTAPIVDVEEDDEALLQRQRQETRRRRRRTMRSLVQVEEAGLGGTAGRRLTRGASMRRRNVWDDVPEFANLDSPTIPEGDETNGEPNETQEDRDAQHALNEPPPPPFPYPTPSTGRLPPAFGSVVLDGAEGRRSPPPSFEVAMRGFIEPASATAVTVDTMAEAPTAEAEEEDENVPSPPSTVSTVRRARIRAETPRQRRRREDRERWQRAREEGKDLDDLIRLETERIERMQHWDRKEEGKADPVLEPEPQEPIRTRASDNALRFSREQKGKGRAVYYYDATDQVLDDIADGPVLSRASSMSTNMARSTIDVEEPDGIELGSVLPIRGNSQEVDLDKNGEGSKMSGFVSKELAMAGINVDELVSPEQEIGQEPEQSNDQQVQLPGLAQGGETVRSHSPSTPTIPTHALSPVSTSTVQPPEKDKIADPSLSPIAHGSRFLEGISEGPDGQLEVVPGTLEPEASTDAKLEPEVSAAPPAVPEKDGPVGDKAGAATVARKPSLPPLFSRKRSGRKISNPWALFRQSSTSNKVKAEPENPADQANSPELASPAIESPEASSPKESGLAKSPFFRAAGQFLKPNLGLEPKTTEAKKESTDNAPQLPVTEGIIPTRPRQVSTSTVNPPVPTGQPHIAYKHPFNRAVKPAWMQQAAPIWQDPKAYVMDEDRSAEPTAEIEIKAIPRVQVVKEPVANEWEMVSSPRKPENEEAVTDLGPLPVSDSQRRVSPAIPPRRPEPPAFPHPRLASAKAQEPTAPSSESSASESDTSEDSDSETSSDSWSVSDAVARPPAAYRLLPPRGIPANVLRAANEPPPLPRRNRENRPKPMGPRQRVPLPPLPPRTRPSAVPTKPREEVKSAEASTEPSTRAPPTKVAVVARQETVEPSQSAAPSPVTGNVTKKQPAESAAPKKRIIPQVETPLTMSQPTTPGIISSTRPTAGDRTPSAISGFFKNGNNEDDRGRSRSYNAGLRPLTITNNDTSKVDSVQKSSPVPQAVPVVFAQSKPLRLAAAPIGGQSRPKATHHATSPVERRSKPAAARLAIKPRYDDRPEQELKSQLSNRINKWRLAAIRPDVPETWEPSEEDDIPPIDRRNPSNGFARSKSMPNFVPDMADETTLEAAVESPAGGLEATQLSHSPVSPQPTGHENGGTKQVRQRTVSNKTQRSSQARETDVTKVTPTPQPIAAPVATASSPANHSLEYTDLDLVAAQLQGTAREYEGMNAITSFVGEEIPRGASPDSLSNLMLGPVEVESRRTTKEGKTKLKLTALGIRVHKCSICLSQFKAGDIMAMMPKCSHLGHQRCVVNWLTKDARCMVCRESL